MSNYFICVGGTGARIGEAFVHLASTGYFGTGETQIWLVDKDAHCGNGNSLKKAVANYNQARPYFRWTNSPCLNHELSFSTWDFDVAISELDHSGANGESPFGVLGSTNPVVNMMMHLMHDVESLNNTMSKGFYGRAQTGTALYHAIVQTEAFKNSALFQAIQKDISNGEHPKVYFAGSSFGATGASLLPNMAKSVRDLFKTDVAVGAVLMLPYFTFGIPEDNGHQLVSSDTHWAKAIEALRYYNPHGIHMSIRNLNQPICQNNVTFDAFYILGSVPRAIINDVYADGGEEQENSIHIAEMYAAMGARHFFGMIDNFAKIDLHSQPAGVPSTFTFNMGGADANFTWNRIDPSLKLPMLDMTRMCVGILMFLHPMVNQHRDFRTFDLLVRVYGKSGWGNQPANIDATVMQSTLTALSDYAKHFITFATQISKVGPDVALYDMQYLTQVQKLLTDYSPEPKRLLRDTTLNSAYDEQALRNLYNHCQLANVRERPNGGGTLATAVVGGDLAAKIIRDLTKVEHHPQSHLDKSRYAEHTTSGVIKICHSMYDYCTKLQH